MRRILTAALAVLAMSFATLSEAATPDARDSDRKQVTDFMHAFDQSWNEHDMRAHAEMFHEDGVWVAWTGEVLKGPAEYEAKLTPLHQTIFKKSVHRGRIEELTFAAPDVAVVRGYGTAVGNEPTPDVVHRYRILVVLTKRDGAWKLSWGQKTRFQERTPDPVFDGSGR